MFLLWLIKYWKPIIKKWSFVLYKTFMIFAKEKHLLIFIFLWWSKIYLKCMFIIVLAELPGATWVNLQPAEHLLFGKQFSKICPSAYSVLGHQVQGVRGRGSNLHQNVPWTGGDMHAKFHEDLCRGLDFHYRSAYQQTNRHLYAHLYI